MSFKRISIDEAQQLMADGACVVVDIRDLQSYQSGRVPKAVHLTNSNLADFLQETDDDQPVIVCCYHGNSSQPVADYLAGQGLTQVYSLDGGFQAWALQQHPVERD